MDNSILTKQKQEDSVRLRPRKANECFIDAKRFVPPAPLFDEFWREGELCLFFGAAGTGKSVLAVQIADALARGRGLDGFKMPKGRRKVLYVDLNLSDTQFQMRYSRSAVRTRSADTPVRMSGRRTVPFGSRAERGDVSPEEPAMRTGVSALRFSENLYRDRPGAPDDLCEWLHNTVVENAFQVVIIDDISAVKRTHDGTRETLSLMRKLRRIREELNISILVLADCESPRRVVSENDLRRSRVLCTAADSVFAIDCDADERYLIQTRSRSASIFWNARNAPICRLKRMDSGMLAFEFDKRFAPTIDEEIRAVISQINSLHDAGRSYRAIAAELGISKSKAHRLHCKWTPAMESEEDPAANEHERTRIEPEMGSETDVESFEIPHAEISIPRSDVPHTEICIPRSAPRSVYDLTRSVDGYGREIFIESKDERSGKPTVWYQIDKNGNNTRYERNMICVKTERLGASVYL